MSDISFILLYVDSPAAGAEFYADILGRNPIEASATFVMFQAAPGVMLGLWGRGGVVPAASAPGGGELALAVGGPAEVDAMHELWKTKGIRILQAPAQMDFGRTFVAADPDGHRLRIFAPG